MKKFNVTLIGIGVCIAIIITIYTNYLNTKEEPTSNGFTTQSVEKEQKIQFQTQSTERLLESFGLGRLK